MKFSLFFFSSTENIKEKSLYSLLWKAAHFADLNDFEAIWTPERHFDSFGAPFASPALTSAALSMITKNIKIRAGSIVLPLHNPIRVAEEWAMLDHFSCGRIGICFASGWHPQDFCLAPGNYQNRKKITLDSLELIQKLWRGEKISVPIELAKNATVRSYPSPLQNKIPIWFAASGHPDTFHSAGEKGVGVLTHLLNQNVNELSDKIAIYRQAIQKTHKIAGQVTLMLHTFIGKRVKEIVKKPLLDFLRISMKLEMKKHQQEEYEEGIDATDLRDMLELAFDRYYKNNGLFGTVNQCFDSTVKLKKLGVDEIACFIDFGVSEDLVLNNLPNLLELKNMCKEHGV